MKNKVLTGRVKRHPDGFGFFIPDDHELPDVYIPRHSMTGVLTNDRVSVQVTDEKGKDRFSGEVLRVLDRAIVQVMGRYVENGADGCLMDANSGWGSTMLIRKQNSMGAKKGELVLAKVIKYPSDRDQFEGEVVEVLGSANDPLHDTRKIVVEHKLRDEFSKSIEKELEAIPDEVTPNDEIDREDLTSLPLITIDGATAKDFDDAICVQTNDSGFKIHVAIADVSHYVKPESEIDKEAYLRGTSTYFPNYVVPMLPEKLSNGLCSLNPNVKRLALVAETQVDFTGEIKGTKIYEAVIKSHARVTYGQAQEVIDGEKLEEFEHVKQNILTARDCAKVLMAKRFKEGALDLEIPESQVIVDDAGHAIDIQRGERVFAHKLIEELMLITNKAVAIYMRNKELPGLHRVHEEPDAESIGTLNKFMMTFGGKSSKGGGSLQKRISKALEQFRGTPKEVVLNIMTLRTMKQAKYSADPIGHFGLGFDDYVHFTSPIRRYPDLVIHRQVKSVVSKTDEYKAINVGQLDSMGVQLSACEQRSVKAERQLLSIKKARLMENVLGQEFEGIISSVTRFGVFVSLREFDVDGLVKIEELSKDRLIFDEEQLALVGKRSGSKFRIGDEILIQVASVDIDLGQVNFSYLGGESPQENEKSETKDRQRGNRQQRKTARQKSKKRGKAKRNRRRSR